MSEFTDIKDRIEREKRIIREMIPLFRDLKTSKDNEEKRLISIQIKSLKELLNKTNTLLSEDIKNVSLIKQLEKREVIIPEIKHIVKKNPETEEISFKGRKSPYRFELSDLEKLTLKRLKKRKKEKAEEKEITPSKYVEISNKFFSEMSTKLSKEAFFRSMKRDLIKANMDILPSSYVSVMLMTTLISLAISIGLILFFLVFNFGVDFPFVTLSKEAFGIRFLKTFWMILVLPLSTFFVLYVYPGVEKKSSSSAINQELPFATIHMSAISGSMIDPTRIFSILIMTKDYPHIAKQFTKLINLIHLQGFSLVNALRAVAFNCPSEKLAEVLNGLATTITSGGDLPNFFEKRAETLLLDYRLEKEKYAKTAETFMDIYISVVIAAPMILMLLLIMMKISGLGIGFSTGMIGLIMALGVSMINVVFLVFLNVRGSTVE